MPAQIIDEIHDQLDNLESLCNIFDHGTHTIYKSVAVVLRLLLVGSSGDGPLVLVALPSFYLPPLRVRPPTDTPPDYLALPGETTISSHGAQITLAGGCRVQTLNAAGGAVANMRVAELFDTGAAPVDLQTWLDQPFFRPGWTLREVIRAVANRDGGAHLKEDDRLAAFRQWGHVHWRVMVGIAGTVGPLLRQQLDARYPAHVRAVR